MAFTTPSTWVAGAILTASQLNVNVRDNTNALYESQKRLSAGTRTTQYDFTALTVATSTDVFAADLSWTANGSSAYRIEFFCPRLVLGGTAYAEVHLVNGAGTDLANLAVILTNGLQIPLSLAFYYTPSAGAQTINVRGVTPGGGGTCTLYGGVGGVGVSAPMFLNIFGPDIT